MIRSRIKSFLATTFVLIGLGLMGAGPNPGPNVVTCQLDGFLWLTPNGPISGINAYTLGTVACNSGNTNLRWEGDTQFHPVIAQNVYRYAAGRFEQIGMSWVKHSFLASVSPYDVNYCGTCNGQGGNVLGVGCSDSYEADINAGQSYLGPRSEINASTGVFPFDIPHNWPQITSDLSRRIQIAATDTDPVLNPGAQYVGEAIYIAQDDSAAGNSWNNASYAPINFIFDPDSHFSATQNTVPEHPAIFAWKAFDPTVRLAALDVPNDGRFWIGHSVTSNANGTWHYEYAVFNLMSDRSGASFTVPFTPGTVITNAAFKGIASHSGEPYSNVPWTIATTPSAISFTVSQTYAQNANANALRWGTMYNFRFDASAAPAEGSVVLGLCKPGSDSFASLNTLALGARSPGGATAIIPVPAYDACSAPLVAHAGENRFSNFNTTTSFPAACVAMNSDVWLSYTYHSFTASCPGSITITTCGSEIPTALAVYITCPSTTGTELACGGSGGAGSCSGSASFATASVPAVEGQTIFIRVGSTTAALGNIVVNIAPPFCIAPTGACCDLFGNCSLVQGAASCINGAFISSSSVCNPNPCPVPSVPSNDDCVGAIAIGDSAQGWSALLGSNINASMSVDETCNSSYESYLDVWYTYTPAQTASVTIDTCTHLSDYYALTDTVLMIHRDACSGTVVGCNDDIQNSTCPYLSSVTLTLTAGTTYYIRVSGNEFTTGLFMLRVTGGNGAGQGACCLGATCTMISPSACLGAGHTFHGAGTSCTPGQAGYVLCCKADFNADGSINVSDIFAFLRAWFAKILSADYNADSVINVNDIFVFLRAWFAKC